MLSSSPRPCSLLEPLLGDLLERLLECLLEHLLERLLELLLPSKLPVSFRARLGTWERPAGSVRWGTTSPHLRLLRVER